MIFFNSKNENKVSLDNFPEKKHQIHGELVQINVKRIKPLCYIIFILAALLIFFRDIPHLQGKYSRGYSNLFLAHFSFIFNTSLILVLIKIYFQFDKNVFFGKFIIYYTIISLLFTCFYATYADMLITNDIIIFQMGALGVAVMVYIKPINSVIIYSAYQLSLIIMISLPVFQESPNNLHYINSAVIILASVLISASLYKMSVRDLIRGFIIEDKKCELEATNVQLKNLSVMKDNFVAMVNHDLKNIMGSIASSTKFLLKRKLPDNFRDYITVLNKTTNTLLKLSDDFLQVSMFQSGRIKLNLSFINLNELIEDVIKTYELIIKSQNKILKRDFAEDITVELDREKMFTVFSNLISNAIKFTRQGDTIKIIAEKTNGTIKIRVIDNGIGIPHDKIGKIFLPYEKVTIKGAKNKHSTGLGLSICKHIVELHNGEIYAESTENVGSNFYFYIPIKFNKNEKLIINLK